MRTKLKLAFVLAALLSLLFVGMQKLAAPPAPTVTTSAKYALQIWPEVKVVLDDR